MGAYVFGLEATHMCLRILCETKGACRIGRPFLWEEVPAFILARVPTSRCESWPILWVQIHISWMFRVCVCIYLPFHVVGVCLVCKLRFASIYSYDWQLFKQRFLGDDNNVPCSWLLRTHYMCWQWYSLTFLDWGNHGILGSHEGYWFLRTTPSTERPSYLSALFKFAKTGSFMFIHSLVILCSLRLQIWENASPWFCTGTTVRVTAAGASLFALSHPYWWRTVVFGTTVFFATAPTTVGVAMRQWTLWTHGWFIPWQSWWWDVFLKPDPLETQSLVGRTKVVKK